MTKRCHKIWKRKRFSLRARRYLFNSIPHVRNSCLNKSVLLYLNIFLIEIYLYLSTTRHISLNLLYIDIHI